MRQLLLKLWTLEQLKVFCFEHIVQPVPSSIIGWHLAVLSSVLKDMVPMHLRYNRWVYFGDMRGVLMFIKQW